MAIESLVRGKSAWDLIRGAGSPLSANELSAFGTRVYSPYVVCFAKRALYALLTRMNERANEREDEAGSLCRA